ncbi:unnamed protein product [Didymodactylos carnosus]|uniref:ABC transporter domain-containing protein n=1 Tax=Didymodactylos carnosus TaxID=1234261 RepID=A0A815H3A7_9BILA|nr:unnamed protein product [Didymodactylos carnosus]CAF4212095.1 unnamed protein product [Didymodactylos carnosus]
MEFYSVYRIFLVVFYAALSVGRSTGMIPDYSRGKAAALRIMELNKRESAIDPNDDDGVTLAKVHGNLEFKDVQFRYPARPTLRILKHFSLACVTNGTTALVGPSGNGKSTCVALLERFYDTTSGSILLDGHDIRLLNLRWYRSIIGLVQQEPVLFDFSIRENIAYGSCPKAVTQEEIEAAAQMSNIHDFIKSLPQGYDTICGARGNQMSGGQKQRIAIARALVRNPKILLMDEATAALDNKSEQIVQQALEQAQTGRTCLSIAHRLTTIRNSEKIAVVVHGRLSEEPTVASRSIHNITICSLDRKSWVIQTKCITQSLIEIWLGPEGAEGIYARAESTAES